ncbi:indole-3-acetic acid-induced protein ARG2 [Vigna umbellata]|uniref:indole-3-acetic acid-induced protein ARG2 n=1 Tax=Vigna umbellata TaxID=87088 RepID=UPI001F5F407F|nr:indole-3-acetic acid-induced protein ARG2 [Vigna umbellata]
MARSFTNVKVLSALVADGFSNTPTRRGFAAAAAAATQSASRGGASISGNMVPKSGEEKVRGAEKVSWVPDPVTGYYRPENTNEIDVADLRATVLGGKFNH